MRRDNCTHRQSEHTNDAQTSSTGNRHGWAPQTLIHRLRRLHRFRSNCVKQESVCSKQSTSCFLSKIFLVPQGPKSVAVGERLCAKPTELPHRMTLTLKESKACRLSDPFRVLNVLFSTVGFAQSRSPTAIQFHPFRMKLGCGLSRAV